ncbi:hypothetical protein BpHYR1_017172 [Brachionus plicatilis]|uniref:Uncharacterized protein n=1 Tax=Brachionus plicatilis TaxID=10195 RepID=A0A3M7SAQ9_BRAPC|nr:hypothetical protein BpHYR1_017172 [Brachionus plicatilis]
MDDESITLLLVTNIQNVLAQFMSSLLELHQDAIAHQGFFQTNRKLCHLRTIYILMAICYLLRKKNLKLKNLKKFSFKKRIFKKLSLVFFSSFKNDSNLRDSNCFLFVKKLDIKDREE